MPLGEESKHLLDLDDLLGGAAQKTQERLTERLAQNSEAGKPRQTSGDVSVTAPRQTVGELAGIAGDIEIVREGRTRERDPGLGGRPTQDAARIQGQPNQVITKNTEPKLVLATPPKGLATVECLGEHDRREGGGQWERFPSRPTPGSCRAGGNAYFSGISQRKLF